MNRTTQMLLEYLDAHLGQEPPAPDLEVHAGHHLNIVARQYDEWERTKLGLHALLGVRLVNEALEQLRSERQ